MQFEEILKVLIVPSNYWRRKMVSEHSLNMKVTKLKTERYSRFSAVSIPLVNKLWFSGQAKSPTTVSIALAEIVGHMHLIRIKESLPYIERFHSRGKHLCKFIGTKESVYITKEFNSQKDFLATPTWPPFRCFGTPIWPSWRHAKTLYIALKAITVECNAGTCEMNYF